jgi:hypothetical protein
MAAVTAQTDSASPADAPILLPHEEAEGSRHTALGRLLLEAQG